MHNTRTWLNVTAPIACVLVACLSFGALKSSCEKKVWRSGTILKVEPRTNATSDSAGVQQYDVSVGVGGKVYVVLVSPPKNKPEPSYYVGMSVAVSIEGDVLKFNDLRGNTRTARILSVEDSPPKPQ